MKALDIVPLNIRKVDEITGISRYDHELLDEHAVSDEALQHLSTFEALEVAELKRSGPTLLEVLSTGRDPGLP